MKVQKIQYKVREDYVETNKANVRAVMSELRESGKKGIFYSTYLLPDGVTFNHIAAIQNENDSEFIPGLQAFKKFREQLKSGLTEQPVSQEVELVGSNFMF